MTFRLQGKPPSINVCDECDASWLEDMEPTVESFDIMASLLHALNANFSGLEFSREPFPSVDWERPRKAPLESLLDLATELGNDCSQAGDEPLLPLLEGETDLLGAEWDLSRHPLGHDYPPLQKRLLVAYLNDCPVLQRDPRPRPDRLNGRFEVADAGSVLSDGAYYWPKEVSTYVDVYDLAISDHVLAHIEDRLYRPPRFTGRAFATLYQKFADLRFEQLFPEGRRYPASGC